MIDSLPRFLSGLLLVKWLIVHISLSTGQMTFTPPPMSFLDQGCNTVSVNWMPRGPTSTEQPVHSLVFWDGTTDSSERCCCPSPCKVHYSMHSQLLHLFTWSRQSYCYHQFKVRMYGIKLSSPAHSFTHASMLPLPAPRLGKIHDACPTLGRPAGIFGHSSHCKAFNACDDMQFCCLVTPVPSKARCQSRCESTVSTAVAITRSHASRETTPSAASLLSASTAAGSHSVGCEKYMHQAVEVYR